MDTHAVGAEVSIPNNTDVYHLCLCSYKLCISVTHITVRVLELIVIICNADTLYLEEVRFSLVGHGCWFSCDRGPGGQRPQWPSGITFSKAIWVIWTSR